jgi:CBS domain-containing protein
MSLLAFTRRDVVTVEPHTTILGAARLMMERCVGALVVSDPSGTAVRGIVSDRDLLYMVSEGLDPKQTTLGCFAQPHVHTVRIDDDLPAVTAAMREHGVRRLPIVDSEGRLVGLIALDDILGVLGRELADVGGAVAEELEHERRVEWLREEIAGGVET